MLEPLISRKVLILGCLIASTCSLFWLLTLPYKPAAYLLRIGFISAVFCTMGTLIFCWAAIFAYLVRKWSWSPRSCRLAGLVFLIPALYFFFLSNNRRSWSIGAILITQMSLTGYVCRRIAFPQLTDEQFSIPLPPPSLFPK
jgi:hypothetical protein